MTEDIHWRCNNCGEDWVIAPDHTPERWARVSIDLARFHYCPRCWKNLFQINDGLTKGREPSDPIERLYGLVEELNDIIANLEDAEKLRNP